MSGWMACGVGNHVGHTSRQPVRRPSIAQDKKSKTIRDSVPWIKMSKCMRRTWAPLGLLY